MEAFARIDETKLKGYKFSDTQIKDVSLRMGTFVRLAETKLSVLLRNLVNMQVVSVEQLSYYEFIMSICDPTTLAIIDMDSHNRKAVLEIDLEITASLIDYLFGGSGENTKTKHELTDIEQSPIEGIIIRLLGTLHDAWHSTTDICPRLRTIETRRDFVQIVPLSETVMLITLKTKINKTEGMIRFCFPCTTITPTGSGESVQKSKETAIQKDLKTALKKFLSETSPVIPDKDTPDANPHQWIPFEYINQADPIDIFNLIQREYPQTIALILAYLEPQKASLVLQNLPDDEIKSEVVKRIALLNSPIQEIVHEVERVLEHKLITCTFSRQDIPKKHINET